LRTSKRVYILTILFIFLFVLTSCSSQQNNTEILQTQSSGTPAQAFVFTYNADCCASTKKLFDTHRNAVKDFESRYGDLVKFTWYDIALQDDSYQKELLEAAEKAGVNKIPAFVVLDRKGNVLARQTGNLKAEEFNKVFERLGG